MNLDGAECTSVGVHVVGVMVGYCGYSNNCTTPSRKDWVVEDEYLIPTLLPAMIRPAEIGSVVTHPASASASRPSSD